MQRRHSSNTDGMPSERSRSQTLGSESSLDEGGVFDCLKPDSPASPQQIFSGLVGVPSSSVSSAQFQAAGLVLGSPPEVFIQMTASSREEGGPHRTEGGPFLPRPPPHHHHHHHHFHHQPLQHRTSSLLQQATAGAASERHSSREETQEDPSTPAPALSELKAVVTWLQRGFPFILILLAKVCFQHKLGIAVCVGMASTFAYANSMLRHQVSLREERSVFVAFWILVFLAGNIFYIYYTFSHEELHNSLMFSKPNLNSFDFFDLIWAVGITDFVLKYFTIGLKCFVLFLPKIFLAFKSRGKFYLLIEELSQLFRALVPIQLWYKYIMGEDPSNSYFLGATLIIIYSLCKASFGTSVIQRMLSSMKDQFGLKRVDCFRGVCTEVQHSGVFQNQPISAVCQYLNQVHVPDVHQLLIHIMLVMPLCHIGQQSGGVERIWPSFKGNENIFL
ncbi:RING finger and transmembrane domain-containing protein 2 isoform X2 [Cheilinus undulatus]|uniref:RING finger and transmembrane domain-containing protein 2 isoform X2 n=1 Tax=Cheilinus undulatus TaxID=241271 RepID=UPI001BD32EFD|nr:RING finger and transmembrane domain-containing protein 2 isoform X2 [Cheilinus undulatus]